MVATFTASGLEINFQKYVEFFFAAAILCSHTEKNIPGNIYIPVSRQNGATLRKPRKQALLPTGPSCHARTSEKGFHLASSNVSTLVQTTAVGVPQ